MLTASVIPKTIGEFGMAVLIAAWTEIVGGRIVQHGLMVDQRSPKAYARAYLASGTKRA